ncbi:competence protein ComJ [Snodgrassella communis]|uniref:Ribosomal RNA large subunit methyltransferase J n=2 Tax=Snodgrassella TaxID=1193515 RepID=A0A2N9XH25_9NEIS|nr:MULTISPECIES: 23S rRNA (adenine(2030)-N(6))-methyltransferase RlmJ [Snodgrassella]KDN14097.1 Protein involved in catabolism of external DNA [Snodgrassella communis]PIT11493.1 competence protein ComJ [Snodgrassella communis]PIT26910.1 competence protein ComJ [Snodgrassella communis]PIT29671.1 competence protein ComJ [Snodgrassella communis]PIT32525.1 competence protein ComJ [Snodgrassella communis]
MLSYRHAFHAGNHADILKHYCLMAVLEYFKLKDKPYCYIDTHAGAGLYNLISDEAQKVGEYREGISRILAATDLDSSLIPFRHAVTACLPDAENHYCGSPWLAQALAREQDRLRLFELHPADAELLRNNMRNIKQPNRAQVFCDDGFKGLLSMLPPPSRRAVVLIDPPYELKQDYQQVVDTLKAALKKFSSGCYMVWYPCLSRAESQKLPQNLQKLVPDNFVQAELHVHAPRPDGFGMHGSGIFIINPPYTLPQLLAEALPPMTRLLAQDDSAHFVLHSEIN